MLMRTLWNMLDFYRSTPRKKVSASSNIIYCRTTESRAVSFEVAIVHRRPFIGATPSVLVLDVAELRVAHVLSAPAGLLAAGVAPSAVHYARAALLAASLPGACE